MCYLISLNVYNIYTHMCVCVCMRGHPHNLYCRLRVVVWISSLSMPSCKSNRIFQGRKTINKYMCCLEQLFYFVTVVYSPWWQHVPKMYCFNQLITIKISYLIICNFNALQFRVNLLSFIYIIQYIPSLIVDSKIYNYKRYLKQLLDIH
jgi:hypothetical protein